MENRKNKTITGHNSGYKQKACHNFCSPSGQFYRETKLSVIYFMGDSGSGQFLKPGQVYRSPGLAKIAPWCLASRDRFCGTLLRAKNASEGEAWTGDRLDCATNAFCSYPQPSDCAKTSLSC
jgi:hypothetical protein